MINNLKIEKPSKKSLYYLGAVLIIAILVGIGYFYYSSKTEVKEPEEKKPAEKSAEEILKSLAAPEEGRSVSKEVQRSLSAPSEEAGEVSEDILKSLSAPK